MTVSLRSFPALRWRRGLQQLARLDYAPVLGLRRFGHGLLLVAAGLALLFALTGQPRPLASWHGMDLLSEGGLCGLLALWLAQLRSSRPPGPVSNRLFLGLAAWLLGAWVDLLDEFWLLPKAWWWDNALESGLTLAGIVLLTWGLQGWRQEQLALNEQLRRRERDWRDHRRLDPVTRLADAVYMSQCVSQQLQRAEPAWLLMLGFEAFEQVLREAGLAEAEALLDSAARLLCLNLGRQDLVCRYAGDRFVLLLPGLDETSGPALERTLAQALAALSHADAQGRRWQLAVRSSGLALPAPGQPEELMLELARRLASA